MSEQMTIQQKVSRLSTKYPELKLVLKELYEDNGKFKNLRSILDKLQPKMVLVGRKTSDLYLWYELSYILRYSYLHITHLTTVDLLESYLGELEDTQRLSQLTDDLVIIRDSRSFVPNRQKPNFVSQVFEQNDKILYYYQGTQSQFLDDMEIFKQYCEDNSIPIIYSENQKVKQEDDII